MALLAAPPTAIYEKADFKQANDTLQRLKKERNQIGLANKELKVSQTKRRIKDIQRQKVSSEAAIEQASKDEKSSKNTKEKTIKNNQTLLNKANKELILAEAQLQKVIIRIM